MTNEEIVKRFQFDFAMDLFEPQFRTGIFSKNYIFNITDKKDSKKMLAVLKDMKYTLEKSRFQPSFCKKIKYIIVYPSIKKFEKVYHYQNNLIGEFDIASYARSKILGSINDFPKYIKRYKL